MDISTTGGHLPVFFEYFDCAKTAVLPSVCHVTVFCEDE